VAFWCGCRLGELVIPSPNLFDPLKHVSRSTAPLLAFILQNREQTHAAIFHIPWTKTTKEQGADTSITARDHRTCPLTAIERHLLRNSEVPAQAPLFSYQTLSGWLPMMCSVFLACCNDIWVAQGFQIFLVMPFVSGVRQSCCCRVFTLMWYLHKDAGCQMPSWNIGDASTPSCPSS
jgi:hypothetical protein